MAIGAIFNSLVYGGVDSADYGVYITGDAVFNAPKRSVELVSVPGRNGAIEIDQGHFENIEVSYPAGMFGDDQTDFRERLSDFRNAIMSQKGYQRLSDTYHPDEYRMGIYVDGLEVEPKHYNEAGQFTLKFNCKPQRWLTSGEDPLDVMDFRGETYEDNAPYLLRRSAGGETSAPFDMEKDTLIGGTIAWNQLVQNGNFADTSGWTAIRTTLTVGNNIGSVDTTTSGDNYIEQNIALTPNHKYFFSVEAQAVGNSVLSQLCRMFYGGANDVFRLSTYDSDWHKGETVFSCANNTYNFLRLENHVANTTNKFKNVILIDLTATFGTEIADYVYGLEQSTAGSGIAWLKSYGFLTKDYYAYEDGSLESVCVSSHDTTGKNLLRYPYYASSTGIVTINSDGTITVNGTASSRIVIGIEQRNTGFELPRGQYVLSADNTFAGIGFIIEGYEGNTWVKNIAQIYNPNESVSFTIDYDGYSTLNMYMYINANTVANNLTFKPMIRRANVTDATFEPYHKNAYPLDSDLELRGIPKLSNGSLYYDGDEYSADGTVTRKYGIVDLGTLDWATSITNVFYSHVVGGKTPSSSAQGTGNAVCSKYLVVSKAYADLNDKDMLVNSWVAGSDKYGIVIKDTAYSDSASFKTALSGVYLVYELDTPTTETADSFTSPQIVDPNGTEEYVDERSVPVPVGHRTVYGMDPSVIVNPTLFDAQPLLEVKGYGGIRFNGYSIELSEQTLGDVEYVAPGTEDVRSGVGAGFFDIDMGDGRINPGDEITVGSTLFECVLTFPNAVILRYHNDPVQYGTNNLPGTLSCSHTSNSVRFAFNSTVETIQWSTEQSTIVQANYRGAGFMSLRAADSSGGSESPTVTFMAQVAIAPNGKTDIFVYITITQPSHSWAISESVCRVLLQGGVEAYSSVPFDESTVYIDCEIGEAYLKNGEEIVSVDRALDLGSDLPVLSPGINEIEYVGSFSDLDIVPRWWRI